MIKRLLAVLLAVLLASPALAQIPGGSNIVINQTPVTGGTPTDCLVVTASGKVGQTNCPAGGSSFATVTGSLIPGNVAIVTATGIADSGSVLVTTFPATTVWGNNSASPAAPIPLAVLNLAAGLVGAPPYSSQLDPTTGLYFPSAGVAGITAGGKLILKLNTPGTSSNSLEISANNTPLLRAVGAAATIQIAGAATGGGVDLMTNGSANFLGRFAVSGTAPVNYSKWTASSTGSGFVKWEAIGGDTNVDMQIGSLGAGLIQFSNSANFAANGSVATVLGSLGPVGSHTTVQKWIQFKDNAGTVLFIPAF